MTTTAISNLTSITKDQLLIVDHERFSYCVVLCKKMKIVFHEALILINTTTQKLHLFQGEKLSKTFIVSTSEKGEGQREGSQMTPLGLHLIDKKIGHDAEPFAIFQSRENTGCLAEPNVETPYIISRILTLRGMVQGYNQGVDEEGALVDTLARYIYIHGTNQLQKLGQKASSGCVRMAPNDMIELFDGVSENCPVFIYKA